MDSLFCVPLTSPTPASSPRRTNFVKQDAQYLPLQRKRLVEGSGDSGHYHHKATKP